MAGAQEHDLNACFVLQKMWLLSINGGAQSTGSPGCRRQRVERERES